MKCPIHKFKLEKGLCPVCDITINTFEDLGKFREPIGKEKEIEK